MSVDHRAEEYDRIAVRRARAPRGERPPSPVAEVDEYITVEQIIQLQQFVRKEFEPEDLDDYKEMLTLLFDACEDVRAQLADIEAEWTSQDRTWFSWGLAEIKAERASLSVNKRLVERALSRVTGLIRNRNRAENSRAEAKAAARKTAKSNAATQAARTAALNADPEFNRARRDVMTAAFKVAETAHDFPEMWELRTALDEYGAQRDRMVANGKESET